ncbi:DUF1963 domain-containing protein [Streptantibioticus ferralitis]|uniref:DUF1963 domain-containing protein n=1 Tax=Streptantibioticus ferralitis TaxID=236510 RepID=A0ABT5Z126_9ACTN|nr:DUF1963 domain-containing protein [Streptantibioticus ferralitis]MDF2257539.1 DUF1963 domain-containing protein [Streptantibioticus ferralitis]
MAEETFDKRNRFREEAVNRGVPLAEVERWIRAVRPAAILGQGGEGPVVAQLGGYPMLPVGPPDPRFPFVASVDCATLPREATDLPLPSDGHLLFFGEADVGFDGVLPELVMYVAAGTPVTERRVEKEWYTVLPHSQLRAAWCELSAPTSGELETEYPHADELDGTWTNAYGYRLGSLQIGGYPKIANWDPVGVAREAATEEAGTDEEALDDDWVLLATWSCDDDVKELDHGLIHWVIRREDLAALRFDRVYVYVHMI